MFTLPSSKHSTQPKAEGYIIVVVLLLAAVLLMLALSFAARTTEQVFLSTQEEDTTRVFNAAESGIEQALYDLDTGGTGAIAEGTTSPGDEATIAVAVSTNDNAQITTRQGETLTIAPTNDLQAVLPVMKWKQPNTGPCVGLLITMYRDAEARHASFFSNRNPACPNNNTLENDLSPDGSGVYTLQLNIVLHFGYPAGSTFARSDMIRVTPLFNNISFDAVRATQIVSTATDQRATGDSSEVRKIEVIRTQPGPPSVFDYAVFSGGDLVKNN